MVYSKFVVVFDRLTSSKSCTMMAIQGDGARAQTPIGIDNKPPQKHRQNTKSNPNPNPNKQANDKRRRRRTTTTTKAATTTTTTTTTITDTNTRR
ncbi:unnamed protein product [[Candida] boidinii]|nr:unnamed protein product [[Candida] boidinii]